MQKETWISVPSFSDVASVSLMRCTTYRVVALYGVLLQAVEDTGAPMGNPQTRFGSDVSTLLDNLKITCRILGALSSSFESTGSGLTYPVLGAHHVPHMGLNRAFQAYLTMLNALSLVHNASNSKSRIRIWLMVGTISA